MQYVKLRNALLVLKISCATTQNEVTHMTRHLGIVHPT